MSSNSTPVSKLAEHNLARNGAAVVRQGWMGVLRLIGSERQSWLQGMVTNEVGNLTPGQGCYAAHLNPQGKIIAQMIVLVAHEEVWLLVERVAASKLAGVFDKLIIMEDVQVQDVSDDYDVFSLLGPQARNVLESWTKQSVEDKPLYSHWLLPQGRVVSSDIGFDVIIPRAQSQDAFAGISSAGATEVGADIWNVLRTESGLPIYGVDIDETTILPELGQRGISYDKGCYIGQEVVARIKYIGHVNRRFVGFIGETETLPEARAVVQLQGKDVGYVTTAVFSPALGKPIALGFVSRVAAEPGKAVMLIGKVNSIPAHVASLPFAPANSPSEGE
jgi:folate-binding protein YgfZ